MRSPTTRAVLLAVLVLSLSLPAGFGCSGTSPDKTKPSGENGAGLRDSFAKLTVDVLG